MPKYLLQYLHNGSGWSFGMPEEMSLFLHMQVRHDFVPVEDGLNRVPHSGQGICNEGVSNSILCFIKIENLNKK